MKQMISLSLLIFIVLAGRAQAIKGSLLLNKQSSTEIQLSTNKIVQLYADFRQGKHNLLFRFEGSGLVTNSEKQEVVSMVFFTTIKRDGKVLASSKRAPFPFFPGDMFLPVETFDFVPLLSNLQNNSAANVSALTPGNYEILLEAKPLMVRGEISPLRILLTIPK